MLPVNLKMKNAKMRGKSICLGSKRIASWEAQIQEDTHIVSWLEDEGKEFL